MTWKVTLRTLARYPTAAAPTLPRTFVVMVLASGALAAHQRPVHRHRLCGVLDAAGRPQTPVRAQRIIRRTVRGAAAADPGRIPGEHGIEQAHATLVRNVLLDPLVI